MIQQTAKPVSLSDRIILRSIPILLLILSGMMPPELAAQQANEQLRQIRSTVTDTIEGKVYYIHTIRRGQTLYMISKAYGVEVNDIIRENPGVREGIKADEKIRIPVPGQPAQKPKGAAVPKKDTLAATPLASPSPGKDSAVRKVLLPCGIDQSTRKEIYHVALMVPLFLGDVGAIDADNPTRKTLETNRSFTFLPFYEGFRMALDSIAQAGISVKLFVYDVDKDTIKTRQLLKKPELKSMDLIIGVLYHQNFRIVADFARKNGITIVNPISERQDIIEGNPFVFKIQPDKNTLPIRLAEYLKKICGTDPVFILRSGQYSDRTIADLLNKECIERQIDARIVEGQQALFTAMQKEGENYIVSFSSKADYVIEFSRRLYEMRNDYQMTLFGLPDWSVVNGVENEYLMTLKTHMIAPFFIDYANPDVRRFVKKYQSEYKTDPDLLAFQGFDIGSYFLAALQQYGSGFARCLGEFYSDPMTTRFRFGQQDGNGYVNGQWMIYRFQGYQLVPVNY